MSDSNISDEKLKTPWRGSRKRTVEEAANDLERYRKFAEKMVAKLKAAIIPISSESQDSEDSSDSDSITPVVSLPETGELLESDRGNNMHDAWEALHALYKTTADKKTSQHDQRGKHSTQIEAITACVLGILSQQKRIKIGPGKKDSVNDINKCNKSSDSNPDSDTPVVVELGAGRGLLGKLIANLGNMPLAVVEKREIKKGFEAAETSDLNGLTNKESITNIDGNDIDNDSNNDSESDTVLNIDNEDQTIIDNTQTQFHGRITADIADLHLRDLTGKRPVVLLAKHLCASASDLAVKMCGQALTQQVENNDYGKNINQNKSNGNGKSQRLLGLHGFGRCTCCPVDGPGLDFQSDKLEDNDDIKASELEMVTPLKSSKKEQDLDKIALNQNASSTPSTTDIQQSLSASPDNNNMTGTNESEDLLCKPIIETVDDNHMIPPLLFALAPCCHHKELEYSTYAGKQWWESKGLNEQEFLMCKRLIFLSKIPVLNDAVCSKWKLRQIWTSSELKCLGLLARRVLEEGRLQHLKHVTKQMTGKAVNTLLVEYCLPSIAPDNLLLIASTDPIDVSKYKMHKGQNNFKKNSKSQNDDPPGIVLTLIPESVNSGKIFRLTEFFLENRLSLFPALGSCHTIDNPIGFSSTVCKSDASTDRRHILVKQAVTSQSSNGGSTVTGSGNTTNSQQQTYTIWDFFQQIIKVPVLASSFDRFFPFAKVFHLDNMNEATIFNVSDSESDETELDSESSALNDFIEQEIRKKAEETKGTDFLVKILTSPKPVLLEKTIDFVDTILEKLRQELQVQIESEFENLKNPIPNPNDANRKIQLVPGNNYTHTIFISAWRGLGSTSCIGVSVNRRGILDRDSYEPSLFSPDQRLSKSSQKSWFLRLNEMKLRSESNGLNHNIFDMSKTILITVGEKNEFKSIDDTNTNRTHVSANPIDVVVPGKRLERKEIRTLFLKNDSIKDGDVIQVPSSSTSEDKDSDSSDLNQNTVDTPQNSILVHFNNDKPEEINPLVLKHIIDNAKNKLRTNIQSAILEALRNSLKSKTSEPKQVLILVDMSPRPVWTRPIELLAQTYAAMIGALNNNFLIEPVILCRLTATEVCRIDLKRRLKVWQAMLTDTLLTRIKELVGFGASFQLMHTLCDAGNERTLVLKRRPKKERDSGPVTS